MDMHEPVEVLSLSDPFKAEVVKDALEAEGIRCFLEGFNQAALPGLSAVPIRVFVEAADAERARQLIAEHEAQIAATAGEEDEDEEEDEDQGSEP